MPRETRSPKYYVAEGIMLRLREAVAEVLDRQYVDARTTARRERAIAERCNQVLRTLRTCEVITVEEEVAIRHKFLELLDGDAEKRKES